MLAEPNVMSTIHIQLASSQQLFIQYTYIKTAKKGLFMCTFLFLTRSFPPWFHFLLHNTTTITNCNSFWLPMLLVVFFLAWVSWHYLCGFCTFLHNLKNLDSFCTFFSTVACHWRGQFATKIGHLKINLKLQNFKMLPSLKTWRNDGLSTRVARFFFAQYTNTGEKYSKLPQNIPDGHKLYNMVVK
jgi:hypothetical protein